MRKWFYEGAIGDFDSASCILVEAWPQCSLQFSKYAPSTTGGLLGTGVVVSFEIVGKVWSW